MKKTTFDKAIQLSRGGVLKDFPCYLVDLPHLPGVEVVVAKDSRTSPRDKSTRTVSGKWRTFDKATGLMLFPSLAWKAKTREECVEHVLMALGNATPASYAEMVNELVVRRATLLLKG
jgi:hypothetical protein